jgi:hypothetical protein
MDLSSVVGIIAVIALAVTALAWATISIARGFFARGRLQGTREAMSEIVRGVSQHYEHDDKPLPEPVGKCIDKMKAQVAGAPNAEEKCEAYQVHFWKLGNVMGEAAWQEGCEAGQRFDHPRDGEMRVDLSLKELMSIRRLASVASKT